MKGFFVVERNGLYYTGDKFGIWTDSIRCAYHYESYEEALGVSIAQAGTVVEM